VAAGVTEAAGERAGLQASRGSRGTGKLQTGQANRAEERRFFLAKHGGGSGVPELGEEFPGEAEAMVESLKTGLSYFVVSEWRGIADFSGKKPQVGREVIRGAPKAG